MQIAGKIQFKERFKHSIYDEVLLHATIEVLVLYTWSTINRGS